MRSITFEVEKFRQGLIENGLGIQVDLKNISQDIQNLYAEDIKISVFTSDFDLESWDRISLSQEP